VRPAELKTLREAVGLSVPDLASLTKVQERTVRYWESGRNSVPDDVAETVLKIDEMLDAIVENSLATVRDLIKNAGEPEEVVLLRYRENADLWRFLPEFKPLPATTHAAMLARLRGELADMYVPSRIVYMRVDEYLTWLGSRDDNMSERSAWAALQS
jgi:transcriptional regulator with XRE-family HTH domain